MHTYATYNYEYNYEKLRKQESLIRTIIYNTPETVTNEETLTLTYKRLYVAGFNQFSLAASRLAVPSLVNFLYNSATKKDFHRTPTTYIL